RALAGQSLGRTEIQGPSDRRDRRFHACPERHATDWRGRRHPGAGRKTRRHFQYGWCCRCQLRVHSGSYPVERDGFWGDKMTNPVLVEVLRGASVESIHSGAVSVFDGDGKPVWEIGDTARAVFPRSAVQAIQALPFVERGAADAYGFGQRELALACASHSGEPAHTELASAMLGKAGLDVSALECGAHWPYRQAEIIDLARAGGS